MEKYVIGVVGPGARFTRPTPIVRDEIIDRTGCEQL